MLYNNSNRNVDFKFMNNNTIQAIDLYTNETRTFDISTHEGSLEWRNFYVNAQQHEQSTPIYLQTYQYQSTPPPFPILETNIPEISVYQNTSKNMQSKCLWVAWCCGSTLFMISAGAISYYVSQA